MIQVDIFDPTCGGGTYLDIKFLGNFWEKSKKAPRQRVSKKHPKVFTVYRNSLVSTIFAHAGNHTIVKFRECFSTKIRIYDLWNFKVPFFAHNVHKILIFSCNCGFEVILN